MIDLLDSKTLYAGDGEVIYLPYISHRVSHEYCLQEANICQAALGDAISSVVGQYSDHLINHEMDGIEDLYDWSMFWLCSAEIIRAIGSVIEGDDVGDDWYFEGNTKVARLFTRTSIHTIELMKSAFSNTTGDPDPLKTMMTSFLDGEGGDQTVARMHNNGQGLNLIE